MNISVFPFLLFCLCFSGCAPSEYHITITDISLPPPPVYEPLEISVLAIYNEKFIDHESTSENKEGKLIHNIQVRESNTKLFDYLLSSVFRDVEIVQKSLADTTVPDGIQLIIIPTLDYCQYELDSVDSYLTLRYRIDFFLPDKEPLGISLVKGQGFKDAELLFSDNQRHSHFNELAQLAMREVAAYFIIQFCDKPYIHKVFQQQCLNQ